PAPVPWTNPPSRPSAGRAWCRGPAFQARSAGPPPLVPAAAGLARDPGLGCARNLSRQTPVAPGALVPRNGRYELGVLGIEIVGIGHSQADRAEQPFDLRSDQLSLLDQRLGALVDGLAVREHQPPVVHVGGA